MEKVKVTVKGAGSLEVDGDLPGNVYEGIMAFLKNVPELKVREIKRGRQPKVKEPQNG